MKQARAFGVGVVVASQNPMDLDYRALSNAGFWAVGRLPMTLGDIRRAIRAAPRDHLPEFRTSAGTSKPDRRSGRYAHDSRARPTGSTLLFPISRGLPDGRQSLHPPRLELEVCENFECMGNEAPHFVCLAQQLVTGRISTQDTGRLEGSGPNALQDTRVLSRSASGLRDLHRDSARHVQEALHTASSSRTVRERSRGETIRS